MSPPHGPMSYIVIRQIIKAGDLAYLAHWRVCVVGPAMSCHGGRLDLMIYILPDLAYQTTKPYESNHGVCVCVSLSLSLSLSPLSFSLSPPSLSLSLSLSLLFLYLYIQSFTCKMYNIHTHLHVNASGHTGTLPSTIAATQSVHNPKHETWPRLCFPRHRRERPGDVAVP